VQFSVHMHVQADTLVRAHVYNTHVIRRYGRKLPVHDTRAVSQGPSPSARVNGNAAALSVSLSRSRSLPSLATARTHAHCSLAEEEHGELAKSSFPSPASFRIATRIEQHLENSTWALASHHRNHHIRIRSITQTHSIAPSSRSLPNTLRTQCSASALCSSPPVVPSSRHIAPCRYLQWPPLYIDLSSSSCTLGFLKPP